MSPTVSRCLLLLLLPALAGCGASAAHAPLRAEVRPFATLPADFRFPESLAVDPESGDVYVASFDAREPSSVRDNQLLRLSAKGELRARIRFGPTPLTGVAFHRGKVYVLNFGASKLQRAAAGFSDGASVEDVVSFAALQPAVPVPRRIANPDGSHDTLQFGANGFAAINGLVFDRAGNAFVSDSFQGAIYRIAAAATCAPCSVDTFARDPLLATGGALPFGANGLALDEVRGHLYVNNAGDGRVLRLALGQDSGVTVLAESLHGADGLLLHEGLLWVAANQADAVVAIDLGGRERVRAGAFLGIDRMGAPRGLLFPAATAVQGRRMLVANLALPLTPAPGDEWEEEVTRWNLMQFDLPDHAAAEALGGGK